MSKDKQALDNHANQLNPLTDTFLQSRSATLTPEVVATIQSAEVKSKGFQERDGLGAQAQRILDTQN